MLRQSIIIDSDNYQTKKIIGFPGGLPIIDKLSDPTQIIGPREVRASLPNYLKDDISLFFYLIFKFYET